MRLLCVSNVVKDGGVVQFGKGVNGGRGETVIGQEWQHFCPSDVSQVVSVTGSESNEPVQCPDGFRSTLSPLPNQFGKKRKKNPRTEKCEILSHFCCMYSSTLSYSTFLVVFNSEGKKHDQFCHFYPEKFHVLQLCKNTSKQFRSNLPP